RFFVGLAKHPPKFKKARKYKSFTFPQSGYDVQGNRMRIGGTFYKFVKHRAMKGQIKTLTVKRDSVGRLWLFFSVRENLEVCSATGGETRGFDFGFKDFLTDNEGIRYDCPEFFRHALKKTRRLSRALSRKVEGSNNYKAARRELAKYQAHVANQRLNYHFGLSHILCDEYDTLYFEDLNLEGMKKLWGRKISDLGFGQFMEVLSWVALKRGKRVVKIGRWQATTQICSGCGQRLSLSLRDRIVACNCGLIIGRDHNAAINIKTVGTSTVYPSDPKTRKHLRTLKGTGSRIDGRSPRL
ncbi:MAG TPA: transposase, partial [Aggregatilineales bacterium]|nr:transposase [Aggregatilineales bacterium]